MPAQFIHLNIHSEYSIVDSTIRIPKMIEALAQSQMPAAGITDFNNMYAAIKFYKAATSAGIKPLMGAEVLVLDENHDNKVYSIAFLCMDNQGYLNLSELISMAHQQGYYQTRPMLRESWIEQYNQGLIAISCNMRGDIGQLILNKKMDTAADKITWWQQIFTDRFYLSIARVKHKHESWHNDACIYLAAHQQIPLVATNDARFMHSTDFNAHEARVCINRGLIVADPRREKVYSRNQYLTTPEEMQEKFADIPQALENTVEIAKRCNFSFNLGEYFLPAFPIPPGETEAQYFSRLTKELLAKYLQKNGTADGYDEADYYNRLKFEVDIILQMGFPGYFLIVADFINWSKKNKIPVGPGRGSGAGSLVAYVMKITDLDPLEYELLFERFLNPERLSMPDFDVDFCMDRRDEVIEYVAKTYGANQVSQIITFGTMSAKAVVRDVGRVLGYPYPMVDGIAKLIPNDLGITLTKALKESTELNLKKETDDEAGELLDMALQLEGIIRNSGKHAGGVVIAPSKLSDFCPIYKDEHSEGILSQYDKDDVETIGLVKFDFLGLRTLTIVDNAVQAINKTAKTTLDITQIPLDDKKVFALLKKCQTTAVFQLESDGMKELIGRLIPDSFAEIIALVALYRPGPLDSGMVDTYVECKHGRKEPDYLHEDLVEVLKPTYGVILYQEQVMKIAQVLAGYSLGAADILRKAMGKKILEVMAQQQKVFVDGAVKNNVGVKLATHIFSMIETFAGYGFNKSHSAAYALIAYQTAWLKAHYPVEFMASVLSADMDNTEKVVHLIADVKNMNIAMQTPNINESDYYFKGGTGMSIIYGLGALKGVGGAAIENMMEERSNYGKFTSIYDFCVRVDLRKVNKRTLESLILAGAFDSLHQNRHALMQGMEDIIKAALQKNRDQESGQTDLFGAMTVASSSEMPIPLPDIADFETNQRLFNERNMLGHFMTGHPITTVRQWLNIATSHTINTVLALRPAKKPTTENQQDFKQKRYFNGQAVIIAGLISSVRIRNENSASLIIMDETDQIEVTFFKNTFFENKEKMLKDEIVIIEGDAGVDNFSNKFIIRAKQILTLNEAIATYCTKIGFTTSTTDYQQFATQLKNLLKTYGKGKARIYIHHEQDGIISNLKLGNNFNIRPSYKLIIDALKQSNIDMVILK
ncbi:DNA polymerase III alpha subunit [hydrothermal vent metagenome]|uniref:DNA polymerase III subunit alpha n=1 Tax=hydrothermal vent metagenome TaxID=652676 RepID=A0A3B0VFB4_9ZZZZ